jgi:transcriptional regulator with XRE-family HTH domain
MPTTVSRKRVVARKKTLAEPQRDPRSTRDKFGLSQADFARLMNCSVRALADWETGQQKPNAGAQRRYAELERLHEGLATIMESDPQSVAGWLRSPNSAFGGMPPLVLVEQGYIDRLWRMIFQLGSGGPS